jgi:hypothetical protein
MTITIPRPVVVFLTLGLAALFAYFAYQETPAMRRYIRMEMM